MKNKGGLKKALCKTLLAMTMTTAIVGAIPMKTFAHDAYFLGITIDGSNYKYTSTITLDDNDFVSSNHREAKLGVFSKKANGDGFNLPSITGSFDDNKKAYEGATGGIANDVFIYTFPGIHTSAYKKSETDATSEDMERAYWVSDNLVNSFNDAIKFVMANADYNASKDTDPKTSFIKLATSLANAGRGGTVSFNGKTFTLAKSPDINNVINGLSKDNYTSITAPNGTKANFVYSVPKGYQKGQPLNGRIPVKDQDKLSEDATVLTWKHIALQGNYNYYVKDISFSQVGEITKPSKFEGMVSDLFSSLLGGLRNFLGIYSFQELMLNSGQRTSAYYYGIMPHSWFESAQILHWICQIIAWVLIIGSIVKLLASRNLASINPAMRVNLLEGVQNLMLTGFMLMFIVPIFHAISVLNAKIVDIFAKSSIATSSFGYIPLTTGQLSAVIINICFFIVLMYFNFVYIIRGITVALLYGTSPLFIVSIGYGGKYKQLFGNWLKELVSNIFMQSFHAICVAFFALISSSGSARTIEQLVLVYSFIPLTQFFRQNLMGLSGGMAEKVAGNALSTGASIATGFVGGAMAGYKGYQSAKTGSGGNMPNNAVPNNNMKSAKDFQGKSSEINSPSGLSITGADGEISGISTANSVSGVAQNVKPGTGNVQFGSNARVPETKYKANPVSNNAQRMDNVASAVKFGAKVVGGMATVGAMMGASAVGDRMTVAYAGKKLAQAGIGTGMAIKNKYQKANEASNLDSVESAYANEYGEGTFEQQSEGFMYAQDLGNGYTSLKYNAEGLSEATGITNMSEINGGGYKNAFAFEYDMDYDANNLNDAFGENNSMSSEQQNNLWGMVNAFKVADTMADKEERAEYLKQYTDRGVLGIEKNAETGKAWVVYDKQHFGVKSISNAGQGSYIIQKGNNAPFSNDFMGYMPKYTPEKVS